jgi:peroxiredoxin Q/BCP
MGPEPTIKTDFIELSLGIFQKNINCANLQQFCGFSVIYIRQKKSKMAAIKVGAKAPAIKGVDQNGETIQLSDFKGQKVVLYFYPKDDTPGCTAQACNLRDNYKKLLKKGLQVLGVSVDPIKAHQKFIKKYDLPFPLISDEDKKIVTKYGLWGEKKFMGRTYMGTSRMTFLIDENGVISHIIEKPDTKNHTEEILEISGW